MKSMLLLDITTFDPENTMELFKRWEHVEKTYSQDGLKVINQWFDAGGGRVVTLFDVETVKDYLAYNLPFTDLCQIDVFPVIEAEDFKKFAVKQMQKLNNSDSQL
ncbi:DUF3303 domain-containing protein [Methanosarcina sp. MSH10X1]|uniref:DUF3303 domain-containing protein n=1 Tax=Methanosarcina sp. MSH10X1 TaxID=2507075 RepID=UPI000FFB4E8B|nr:DUF3303 family protein [Methanosarcina sp. MSH10X1]RXA21860.1 DUF3303 domain-containing protein [Methanosarcina sp. MSH10X1]